MECILHEETIWLTQKRIADLFGVGVPAISKHLKNIFDSGELQEEVVVSILETTTQHGAIEGKTQTQKTRFYNLDAIITSLTMESFAESVNRFLEFNEYRILEGYGSISRKQAEEKAFAEYDKFNKTQRIESDFDKVIKQIAASKNNGGNHE